MREILKFLFGEVGKVKLPTFFPDGPWRSPYNENKNLAPTPNNFGKMGCKCLEVEAPRGPGGNIVGVA